MKSLTRYILSTFLCSCLLFSCTTTGNLPEGENLYTGIGHITYPQNKKKKEKQSKKDSTGVIVAIAESAQQIENILSGTSRSVQAEDSASLQKQKKALSKAANAEYMQALETAQEEVNAVLEYAPNNALFGSSFYRTPFPVGLWAYNKYINKEGKLSKWMFKSFASNPVLVSTVNPDTRIKVATNTLRNYGFFHGKVTYDLTTYGKNKRKTKINYSVNPGKVFRLDSISYKGFPHVSDSLIRKTRSKTYLHKGDQFNAVKLTNEQRRIEELLRNEGYFFFRSSHISYKADTVMKPYKVQLVMNPQANIPSIVKRRWYMGNTYIHILKPNRDSVMNTFQLNRISFVYNGKKIPLRPIVWLQNIAHRPNSLYRQTDQNKTQELLSSLGIFNQININYVPRDTSNLCDTLDMHISATLDQPFTSNLELNVTEKNSDRISPGLSFNIQRKNLFRGGELLNWKLYGSYEWRTHQDHLKGQNLFNSYEVGTQLSIDFAHILFPGITRRTFHFPTQTTVAVSADWMNRAQYYNLFSLGVKMTYSWQKHSTTRHEFSPFSLYYDKLLSSSHTFDSIMTENPALYISMRDRFVPSMQYTFTYQSAASHRNPLWFQFSIKEAGNIVSGLFALSGQSLSKTDKQIFNNPFAQYIKITSELHNKFRIRQKHHIVTRLSAGLIYAYGNSTVAPYSDQFFVGGANSVRAFTIRTLGPGHYTSPQKKYSYMDQTGDIKLEANVEYRFPLLGNLNGAAFIDAGNVWLLRKDEKRPGGRINMSTFWKDIALGTGLGLRYDMDFLVLRLDWGMALHNPANTHKSGYYNIDKLKDNMALHFAVGYPF